MKYGYARVSTKEQNLERQLFALNGVEVDRIYADKESGKDFHRPQYEAMMRVCQNGDTIIIKSIDRLGRNYDEILSEWRMITKEKGVNIIVLDMPLLNTENERADLTNTLIADMVLQILSYVAQVERENTRQRQKEGIAAAKRNGVRFGRPELKLPKNFPEVRRTYLNKEISSRQACSLCGMTHTSFLRKVKEFNR